MDFFMPVTDPKQEAFFYNYFSQKVSLKKNINVLLYLFGYKKRAEVPFFSTSFHNKKKNINCPRNVKATNVLGCIVHVLCSQINSHHSNTRLS